MTARLVKEVASAALRYTWWVRLASFEGAHLVRYLAVGALRVV